MLSWPSVSKEIGGVPAVLLTDRMGCLRAATVAGLVVPHPDYLRFATHYGFRPDFCEAADPESKGMVEHLVGYAKSDLLVAQGPFPDLAQANTSARLWCEEVNARLHTETSAVPAERLLLERPVLRPLPSLRPPLEAGGGPHGRSSGLRALRLRPLFRPLPSGGEQGGGIGRHQ